MARNLAASRSHLLGFLASDLSNPAYVTYYHTIENVFRPLGYEILISDSERSHTIERANLDRMLDSRVEGFFIFPVSDWDIRVKKECARSYARIPVPKVILGHPLSKRLSHIHPDETGGATMVAEHFISQGHRRCLFLNSDVEINPTATIREEAFRKGFVSRQRRVMSLDMTSPDWMTTDLHAISHEGLTALVGVNHLHAAEFCRRARDYDIEIPRQISAAACDDGQLSEFLSPALTCAHMDQVAVARRAAALLAAQLETNTRPKAVNLAVPYHLIERSSVTSPG